MGRKKQSAPPAGARIPNIVIFIGSALATVVTAALIAHFTKSPPTAREQHQQPHSQPPSPRSVYPTKSTTDSNTRDAAVEKARALIGSMTGWGHTASRALDAACAELATLLSPHVSETRIGLVEILWLRSLRLQNDIPPGTTTSFADVHQKLLERPSLLRAERAAVLLEVGHWYLQWDRHDGARHHYQLAQKAATPGTRTERDAAIGLAMCAALVAGCETGGHNRDDAYACMDALNQFRHLESSGAQLDAAGSFMFAHLLWYTAMDASAALAAATLAVSQRPDGKDWWSKLRGWAQMATWGLPSSVEYDEESTHALARRAHHRLIELGGEEAHAAAMWQARVEQLKDRDAVGGGDSGDGHDGDMDDTHGRSDSAFTLFSGEGDECESIDVVTARARWKEIIAARAPVRILGATAGWPSAAWSDAALAEAAGDCIVPVSLFNGSSTNRFELMDDTWRQRIGRLSKATAARNRHVLVRPSKTFMRLRDFASIVALERRRGRRGRAMSEGRVYMHQTEVSTFCPSMLEWVRPPSWTANASALREIHLWWSSGETLTTIHRDSAHNIMSLVSGSKEFLLFPPEETEKLYYDRVVDVSRVWNPDHPAPPEPEMLRIGETSGHGLVDVTQPDLGRHPAYAHARGMRCKIQEGEAIFVPARWHHAVHSPDDASNIGVSFWYKDENITWFPGRS